MHTNGEHCQIRQREKKTFPNWFTGPTTYVFNIAKLWTTKTFLVGCPLDKWFSFLISTAVVHNDVISPDKFPTPLLTLQLLIF